MRVRGGVKRLVAEKKFLKKSSFQISYKSIRPFKPSSVQVCILNPSELYSHIAASECERDLSRLVV